MWVGCAKLRKYELTVIQMWQNSCKQEVKHYVLIFTDLILFEAKENYHSSGRNLLLNLFIKKMVKFTIIIIEKCH
jgi:hypothetical protein